MENKKLICAICIIALLFIPGVYALNVPGSDSRTLTENANSITVYLNSTEIGDYGDYYGYSVTLYQNQKIRLTLTVPSGADFDVVVYAPDDVKGWENYSSILGQDEILEITAPEAGTYDIYVLDWSGSGTYTLSVENLGGIDYTLIAIIVAVIVIVIVLIVIFLLIRRRKGRAPAPVYGAAPPPPVPPMTQPSQPTVAPQTQAPPPTATCPSCGGPLTWIPEYKRWYCYKENKYA